MRSRPAASGGLGRGFPSGPGGPHGLSHRSPAAPGLPRGPAAALLRRQNRWNLGTGPPTPLTHSARRCLSLASLGYGKANRSGTALTDKMVTPSARDGEQMGDRRCQPEPHGDTGVGQGAGNAWARAFTGGPEGRRGRGRTAGSVGFGAPSLVVWGLPWLIRAGDCVLRVGGPWRRDREGSTGHVWVSGLALCWDRDTGASWRSGAGSPRRGLGPRGPRAGRGLAGPGAASRGAAVSNSWPNAARPLLCAEGSFRLFKWLKIKIHAHELISKVL